MRLSAKNIKLEELPGKIRVSFKTVKGTGQWYYDNNEFHEAVTAYRDLKANGVTWRKPYSPDATDFIYVPVYNDTIQISSPF